MILSETNSLCFVALSKEHLILFQASSPACTELEMVVMDWLGKMLDLPQEFLFCSGGRGGGVIQVQ